MSRKGGWEGSGGTGETDRDGLLSDTGEGIKRSRVSPSMFGVLLRNRPAVRVSPRRKTKKQAMTALRGGLQ